MYGYNGRILYIDLAERKIEVREFGEDFARKYLGGNGFGIRIMLDNIPKGADPLGDENVLIIATGPVNGSFFHGAGRTGILCKSPLTGLFMDSYFGGSFAAGLKYGGFDAIVLMRRADSPVAIVVDNGEAKIIDASEYWGLGTQEAQERFKDKYGGDFQTLAIGPAGENLVPMACTIGKRRASGRGGTGAVLGSKKVKLVAARGIKDVTVARPGAALKLLKKIREEFDAKGKGLKNLGTPVLVNIINNFGGLGSYNDQQEVFDKAEDISGEKLNEEHLVRHLACYACNVGGCSKIFKTKSGPESISEGPEYETLYAIGSMCGVGNLDDIIRADWLCDDLGVDTISFGVSTAFLMECYQKGLVPRDELDGLDFSFGNSQILPVLVEKVAKREGVGAFLGQGTKRMAQKIGKGSEKFAMNTKGLEFAGHSGRAMKNMGLNYAVSSRGGSHHDGRPGLEYKMTPEDRDKTEGKARLSYNSSNWTAIGDSMIICHMLETVGGPALGQLHVDIINSVTGWDMTPEELENIACRIYTMERCFNVREGISRKDDTLPYRYMYEPIPEGTSKGLRVKPEELQSMLDEYYELRGWDKNGIPTKGTLERLGIADIEL